MYPGNDFGYGMYPYGAPPMPYAGNMAYGMVNQGAVDMSMGQM